RHRRIPHCERHFALRISFIGCKPSRVHVTDLLYAGVSGEMGSGRTGDPLPTELLTSLKKQQRLRCAKTISHLREDIVETVAQDGTGSFGGLQVGVDIGGTFTDTIAVGPGGE